jgi:hypothetical protein
VNTSFVERQSATDRCRNARMAQKTYRFRDKNGRRQEQTTALAAELTEYV